MINQALDSAVKQIREKSLKRHKRKGRLAYWKEQDYLEGQGTVDAGVIILPTRGCRWGLKSGCTMCGYVNDSADIPPKDEELLSNLETALEKLDGVKYLKLFNSGSFFDPLEISQDASSSILSLLNGRGIDRVQVESRPEFINEEVLGVAIDASDFELEVGLGVETTSDKIRRDCINKNISLEDFNRAIGNCKNLGVLVKGYLLLKPLFLTEAEAIHDTLKSAEELAKMGASRISINPLNIQRGTLVEYLWDRKEYRPPWLWSVLDVLKKASDVLKVPVLSHPSAAGKARGPHNCGVCDSEVKNSIMDFSVTQNKDLLTDFSCDCMDVWTGELELEQFAQGVLLW